MNNPHAEIIESLRLNRAELLAREGFSEEDTKRLLIAPFLAHLGYPETYRRSEYHVNSNQPDEVIWDGAASAASNRPARIILEAKPLGTGFDTGASRTETPSRQLRRYLQGHQASGADTYGVLTDGNRYRVSQRTGNGIDVKHVGEWNILDGPDLLADSEPIADLFNLLSWHSVADVRLPDKKPDSPARALTDAIAEAQSPSRILNLLTRDADLKPEITTEIALAGRALDAARTDWESHAWRYGAKIRVDTPGLEGDRVVVAVIRYAAPEPGAPDGLPRGDVALAARTFARADNARTSAVIAYQANANGFIDCARAAVHHRGHTGMTPEFDPQNPPPSVLNSLEQVLKNLRSASVINPERLTNAVAAKTIRREFYESIAEWTKSKQAGRSREQRQTILRHLIRTVFAWILKEDGVIPSAPFEESFAAQHGDGDYHRGILSFLFHKRLNTPGFERVSHPSDAVELALADAPFLNGSLFAEHPGDDDLRLSDEDYFGISPAKPGLFTIMSRYDWTAAEHTPGESDQTIDPEMLSNLFENLVAATEFWEENPDRMPAGTYYTPADIATEMVKDALAAAVRNDAPDKLTDAHLRDLFSDPDTDIPRLTANETRRLRQAISRLTIFDPSVGSGEFPLIALTALRTALNSLGDGGADLTRHIIESQIYAQDINRMAVQITRLRLFIAIMSAERGLNAIEALPNLESRIVCADTLETVARPEWRPDSTGQLVDDETKALLTKLARIRRDWLTAHTESDKENARLKDAEIRAQLLEHSERNETATLEIDGFARHPLLDSDGPPADTDARLLFYDPDWRGFDVVIGNPPYEAIGKGQPRAQRNALRNRLRGPKAYTTVAGGDLYNLFCEVALTLAKPEDGVVTLVVPLSLAFGQNKATTRRLFEQRAKSIRVRHQDNRPDKTFHESPVAHRENRQRTAIITAVTGAANPTIETTGTSKWGKAEREQYLLSRRYTIAPNLPSALHGNLANQWPRVPTEAISRLAAEMLAQRRKVSDLAVVGANKRSVAFPKTAYEFITAAPTGILARGETVCPIADTASLELAVATLNSHIAYAWWRVWGDAFHINEYELTSLTIPNEWLDDGETNAYARRLGRRLIAAITPENIDTRISGTRSNKFENINFHEVCPEIIRQIDELYLSALGVPVEPLLTQLRAMRSNSNWRL